MSTKTLPHLNIGILNPGRCGFATLSGQTLLWWRLWEVASACQALEVHLLVVPGPRLPQGTKFPP
eukprot:1746337-Karenia_brevis.AAC.1